MDNKTFHWDIRDSIGVFTIENTSANILNRQFFAEFQRWASQLQKHQQLKGIVLTAAGRHFSCGADLIEISEYQHLFASQQELTSYFRKNTEAILQFRNLPIPKVALVKGVCLGAGLELALTCNYIISNKKAMLGFPEVSFDLMPGWSGMRSACDRLSKAQAFQMVLSGRNYIATEAQQMGLIDEIVSNDELLDTAFLRIDEYDKTITQ